VKDKDVDAVGACVGMKGMRVQSIIRELRGKRSTSSNTTKIRSLRGEGAAARESQRVTIVDAADKHLEVVVDDTSFRSPR